MSHECSKLLILVRLEELVSFLCWEGAWHFWRWVVAGRFGAVMWHHLQCEEVPCIGIEPTVVVETSLLQERWGGIRLQSSADRMWCLICHRQNESRCVVSSKQTSKYWVADWCHVFWYELARVLYSHLAHIRAVIRYWDGPGYFDII